MRHNKLNRDNEAVTGRNFPHKYTYSLDNFLITGNLVYCLEHLTDEIANDFTLMTETCTLIITAAHYASVLSQITTMLTLLLHGD